MPVLCKQIRRELDATGLAWRIEEGKRHIKVFMQERMIMVLPRGDKAQQTGDHKLKNDIAQIRRAARACTGEQNGKSAHT